MVSNASITETDIKDIIRNDPWMMFALRAVRSLGLPDAWVGAGFVRNKVWDTLSGLPSSIQQSDVDVIFYDPDHVEEIDEKILEEQLRIQMNGVLWSVKNHARMHLVVGDSQYHSCADAMSHWPETATAIAVRLNEDDTLSLLAPWGISDLVHMIIRISPKALHRAADFQKRIVTKKWIERWPLVTVIQ